jgi:hypothetical protein
MSLIFLTVNFDCGSHRVKFWYLLKLLTCVHFAFFLMFRVLDVSRICSYFMFFIFLVLLDTSCSSRSFLFYGYVLHTVV